MNRVAGSTPEVVTVRMPAAGVYLSVLRTTTASLAARCDFTLDEMEDLKIAVDEACAVLLSQAVPGGDISCEFELDGDAIAVTVTVMTVDGEQPSRDTFAWTVLAALAGEVDSTSDAEGRVSIALHKRRAEREDVA